MNIEFLSVLLLASLWVGIGITVARARRDDCSIRKFYFTGSLWASLLLGIFLLISGESIRIDSANLPALIAFSVASLLNGIGQALTMLNLKGGASALAYAIPLLGFVLPFIWSGIFLGEHMTGMNIAGLVMTAFAVVLAIPQARKTHPAAAASGMGIMRLLTALAAMIILGFSQIFMIYPTLPQNAQMHIPSSFAAFVVLLTNTIVFGMAILFRGSSHNAPFRRVLTYGLFWGGLAVLSYLVLFLALRLMGKHAQAGIVFPVACAMTIVGFSIFSRVWLKEILSRRQILALAAIIVGIFMIKLK